MSRLAKFILFLAFAASTSCKNAVPQITTSGITQAKPVPQVNNKSSTQSSLAAASGVASVDGMKIKFSIGYNQTGNLVTDGSTKIRPTSAGVADEQ